MNVIVTGGGSGGHIYPALTIADEFMLRDENTNMLYIGSHIGIESDIVPEYGYDFKMVDSRYFDVVNPIEAFKTITRVTRGVVSALKIMKSFKPDIVIGTGGYVCVPVIIAGKLYGAKTFIHEQNVVIGLSNKLLQYFVNKIFVAFETGKESFKKRKKVVFTGNPVRKSFFPNSSFAETNEVNDHLFTIFLLAGSQGADTINELGVLLIEKLASKGYAINLCTGPRRYDSIVDELSQKNVLFNDDDSNIKVLSYIDNMNYYIESSDIVIGRAGSLSISEVLAVGRPSILIPSPNVVGNHQFYNAKAVVDEGAAIMVEEKNLNCEELIQRIIELKDNSEMLSGMAKQAKRISIMDASEKIYENIMNTVNS